MAAKKGYRLLLLWEGKYYKFITHSLNHRDGSLHVSLVRKGKNTEYWKCSSRELQVFNKWDLIKETRVKQIDISYHTSGYIHYKNTSNKSIFCEPLLHITRHFCFAVYSIPDILLLDSHITEIDETDTIFGIPESLRGRLYFSFYVSPLRNLDIKSGIRVANIAYQDVCNLSVVLDYSRFDIPDELKNSFVFFTPDPGLFDKAQLDEDKALIEFHQKIANATGPIVYEPNGEGIYRLIYGVSKVRRPDVNINFVDESLSAEMMEIGRAYVLFRVRDSSGNVVKQRAEISGVTLDSRL